MSNQHQQKITDFLTWFTQNGGTWSNAIRLQHGQFPAHSLLLSTARAWSDPPSAVSDDTTDEKFGYHVVAATDIPTPNNDVEQPLIACPFGLTITEPLAKSFVLSARSGQTSAREEEMEVKVVTEADKGEASNLNERQWIASYLVLHLIGKDEAGLLPST